MNAAMLLQLVGILTVPKSPGQITFEKWREKERIRLENSTPEELEWRRREGMGTSPPPPWDALPAAAKDVWEAVEVAYATRKGE